MKIAFVVHAFPTLSETFVLNQITGLVDRGHDVDIFAQIHEKGSGLHADVLKYGLLKRTFYTPSVPADKAKRWVKGLYLLVRNFSRSPRVFLSFLNFTEYDRKTRNTGMLYSVIPFLGGGRYDIAHAHFGPNGDRVLRIRKMGAFEGKVVTTFHGFDVSQYLASHGKAVYEELYRECDLFISISDFWKKKLIANGCPSDRIIVHHMGVNLEKLPFKAKGMHETKNIIVLSIARLVEKKGIEFAIKAVGKVAKDFPKVIYKIAGTGPLQNELKVLVMEEGLSESVQFLGAQTQEQIRELLDEASIFLAPSVTGENGDMEGIPVSIMEAMAVGLPVLSTWHSGIPELVQDGKSGFLLAERDSDKLAEKLRYLLNHPHKWGKMGLAGRAHVEANFNIEKLNDHLVKIFKNLLDKKESGKHKTKKEQVRGSCDCEEGAPNVVQNRNKDDNGDFDK